MQPTVKIKTASHGPDSPSLLIIYTGGTFGMAYDSKGTLLQPFNFSEILEKLPELNRFEMELNFISIEKPLDSAYFNEKHWIEIAEIIYSHYEKFDGFVVLHGTDTMAYSASALSFMLENLNKPVIFTGAQLPIGVARTDARENFITSLEIAANRKGGKPLVKEVCIYFDYDLLRGNRAKKMQSNQFDAFVSENYPSLAKAGVTIEYNESALAHNEPTGNLVLHTSLEKNIGVIKLFPGITRQAVEAVLHTAGLQGVILESYGSGNAPEEAWLIGSLKDAIEKNITVMNISQCAGGKVLQGKYQSSRKLKEIGVVSGGNMTFEAAVAKMMFVLGMTPVAEIRKALLEKPLAGELDLQS